jgi:hypothetical protein
LNYKFIEPIDYDILCSSFNYNTPHDIRYMSYLKIKHNKELTSINAGLMKFNNIDSLVKYYELVDRNDINNSNVMYYEQILPTSLDIKWGYYYDSRKLINPPYWYTDYHLLSSHVDFTNKYNQFCHFMGNLKNDTHLLSLLEHNLKNIYKEYGI